MSKNPHPTSQLSPLQRMFFSIRQISYRALVLLSLQTLMCSMSAVAAVVSSTSDSGAGSLRDAVSAEPAGGTITFDASLNGATIVLNSEILIDKQLTINATSLANGCKLDGNNLVRLMRITATGQLTLRNISFTQGRGLGAADHGLGGAIYNAGSLTIVKCSFIRNFASNYGGAVFNGPAANLSLQDCNFEVNSTTLFGGALSNAGTCSIDSSTFHGCSSAYEGGAIYSASTASLVIRNSTFGNNSATYHGGAIYNNGMADFDSLTIFRNSATRVGGGLFNDFFGQLSLDNSIVAKNTAPSSPDLHGNTTGSRNFVGGDPKLSELANWGGPTETYQPLPGSPVIDAGGFTTLTTDQRGLARVLADALDIGAFELAASDYSMSGLTLYSRVPLADSDGVFEISTDPRFSPFVSTFAGTGVEGFADGALVSSRFGNPAGVATDTLGNIFVADTGNNRIRMITPNGQVTTIAGTGEYGIANGAGLTAKFAFPSAIAIGPDNNLYVADTFNHRICKLTRPLTPGGSWNVSQVAGSPIGDFGFANATGNSARFHFPYGLSLDSEGAIFVADSKNHRIRRISLTGNVTTYAGGASSGNTNDLNPALARFNEPTGIVVAHGNVYVADTGNHRIRKIVPASSTNAGPVTTFAGDVAGFANGLTTAAAFRSPAAMTVDANGIIYVADEENHSIRSITQAGEVDTVVGLGSAGFVNGDKDNAKLNAATGIAVDSLGNLLVADTQNHVIRAVNIKPLSVPATVITGSENASGIQVSSVIDLVALGLDPLKTYYFRWKSNGPSGLTTALGHSFFAYDIPVISTNAASQLIPTSARLNATVDPKSSLTSFVFEYSTDPDMRAPFYVRSLAGSSTTGYIDATGNIARFSMPNGMAINSAGDVFVADRANHRIRKISPAGETTTFAGSGDAGFVDDTGVNAQFENPNGIAIDSVGNLYVADEANHCIRKITPAGVVSTYAGSGIAGFADGNALDAKFLYPTGVAIDSSNHVYVADSQNNRIRKIDAVTGMVTTFAGSGVPGFADGAYLESQFSHPIALAINAAGGVLVVDHGNLRIRLIDIVGVSTLAGNGSAGMSDGPGATAQFDNPTGIAVDAEGVAYVTDTNNHRIRRITTDAQVSTIAGTGVAGVEDSPTLGLYPAQVTQFQAPRGIAIDSSGKLYISQAGMIRTLARSATAPILEVLPAPEGSGSRLVFADITEPLLPGATYYFRAVGDNPRGTVRGAILPFTTPVSGIAIYNGDSTSAPTIFHNQTDVVDFQRTPTGKAVVRSFTIENLGGWPLKIKSITAPFGYQLSGVPSTVNPFSAVTFTMALTATSEGLYSGNLVVASDALEQPVFLFPVSGLVLDPPVVVTLDALNISNGAATFRGSVNPKGSDTQVWFEWSRDAEFDGVDINTFVGSSDGFANDVGVLAKLNKPNGIVEDATGNLYVADTMNHLIRKIAPDGTVSTHAGTGSPGFVNGSSDVARFNEPMGLVINAAGDLFVSDSKNHCIRKISIVGEVTTYSGLGTAGFTNGIATAARFRSPAGMAIDSSGILYVADTLNHRIRKIALDGSVSTHAGLSTAGTENGIKSVARFTQPKWIALDQAGNLFVTEATSHAIRKVSASSETTLFAGSVTNPGLTNGAALSALFNSPGGVAFSENGDLFIADSGNKVIRSISQVGTVSTFAGLPAPSFDLPNTVLPALDGNVYVTDTTNSLIRKISSQQVLVAVSGTLVGNAPQTIELPVSNLPTSDYYFRMIASNFGGKTTGLSKKMTFVGFQQWQENHFGGNGVTHPQSAPLACPANDGLSNLVKYALGLDPCKPSATEGPVVAQSSGKMSMTYKKSTSAVNALTRVEWSCDLVNWHTSGVTYSIVSDDGHTQEIRASVTAGDACKFLRLSVTQQQ